MDPNMDPQTPTCATGYDGANADQPMQQDQDQSNQYQQQEQAEMQQQPQLTDTVRSGLEAINSRKQEIHAKIDDLSAVGLQFLENAKINFLQLIENYRKDVDGFCDGVVASNGVESEETIKAIARLDRAQRLVQSLGLAAADPGMEI